MSLNEHIERAALSTLSASGHGSQQIRTAGALAITHFMWSGPERRIAMAVGTGDEGGAASLVWQRMLIDGSDWYLPHSDGSASAEHPEDSASWTHTRGPGYPASPLSVLFWLRGAERCRLISGSLPEDGQVEVLASLALALEAAESHEREDVRDAFAQVNPDGQGVSALVWVRDSAVVATAYTVGSDFRVDTQFTVSAGGVPHIAVPATVTEELDLRELFDGMEANIRPDDHA